MSGGGQQRFVFNPKQNLIDAGGPIKPAPTGGSSGTSLPGAKGNVWTGVTDIKNPAPGVADVASTRVIPSEALGHTRTAKQVGHAADDLANQGTRPIADPQASPTVIKAIDQVNFLDPSAKIGKTEIASARANAASQGVREAEDAYKGAAANVGGVAAVNPSTRLPRTNGTWVGEPGNGAWYSTKADVNAITGGEPVQFTNGRPVFSPQSKGQITFEKGVLNGTESDFNAVYDYVKEQKGLSSRTAAENYLRKLDLTPRHLNNTTIQLIPT